MINFIFKLALILGTNLIISIPLYAKSVEQKQLNFPIKSEELMQGEIHYFYAQLSPRKLVVTHPELFDIDSLSLIQENNVTLVVSKVVSVVQKPAGFFDDKQMSDEKFVAFMLGDQKIKKAGPAAYLVTVPGEGITYKMQSFFDADDVSTLPNSKVIRAVSAAKKLDVISQGASTIMFTEKTNYSKYSEGAVSVSSFIPLKESKTLMITYNIWAMDAKAMKENDIKENFLTEIAAIKRLMEEYK